MIDNTDKSNHVTGHVVKKGIQITGDENGTFRLVYEGDIQIVPLGYWTSLHNSLTAREKKIEEQKEKLKASAEKYNRLLKIVRERDKTIENLKSENGNLHDMITRLQEDLDKLDKFKQNQLNGKQTKLNSAMIGLIRIRVSQGASIIDIFKELVNTFEDFDASYETIRRYVTDLRRHP